MMNRWSVSCLLYTSQVTYYRALIIAGPSAKGQELAAKINNGETLTKEDLESAVWGVQGLLSLIHI